MIISMLLAPVVIEFCEPIVRKLTANDWLARAAQLTQIAATTMARQEHIIICGYGRSGQNLARLLEAEDISYVAMDSDPQRVREAAGAGSSVVYGDAGRRETLVAAGLAKARAVVVTFADTAIALKILHHVQQMRPELPVVVRTVDDSELDRLMAAGASEVVPEVLEGSLMLASHSLLLVGVPLHRVLKRIRAIREERYGLFRGFFHGATDTADAADNLQARLHYGGAAGPGVGGGPHARRTGPRRAGRGDRGAPARRALAAPRGRLALRGRGRRRAARPAGESRRWPSRSCSGRRRRPGRRRRSASRTVTAATGSEVPIGRPRGCAARLARRN